MYGRDFIKLLLFEFVSLILQLWSNYTYSLMSIELNIDRDLTTRNLYLCAFEPRKSFVGPTETLMSMFNYFDNSNEEGGSDDYGNDGRWVNQGDMVAISSSDVEKPIDNLESSSPSSSRWGGRPRARGPLLVNFDRSWILPYPPLTVIEMVWDMI